MTSPQRFASAVYITIMTFIVMGLGCAPAFAQNVTCSTRPAGDSTNACASTKFVQSAAGSFPITVSGVTSGGIPCFTSASVMSSSAVLTANSFMVGGGAGVCPLTLTGAQATALLNAFVGDSGSGGTKGLVPAPAAGDAAAGKVIGAGGGWVLPSSNSIATPGGRLTLVSSTPVVLGNATSATTLYYAPYMHAFAPIYNGTSFVYTQFTSSATDTVGLSLGTFGTGWAVSTVHDVFITLNGGNPVLCTGPAWTAQGTTGNPSGTPGARAAAGSLAKILGIYVNSNAAAMTCRISNSSTISVSQYQATYLGTILTDGAGKLDFYHATAASGGSPGVFWVWNYYNRVPITSWNFDSGATYTYSAATCRVARASSNNTMFFVSGFLEDSVSMWQQSFEGTTANVGAYSITGAGINTSAPGATCFWQASWVNSPVAAVYHGVGSSYSTSVAYQIGANIIYSFEMGDGTHANTMNDFGQNTLNFSYPM